MEGEWSCYGGCHFNRGRSHIRGSELVSLKEGGWSCYGGGQLKGTMFVREVACLIKGN